MSRYLAYTAYVDSGVSWLKSIPVDWRLKPLKHIADFINGYAFKPDSWCATGTPIIRIENLNGSDSFNCYDGEIDTRYKVRQGDLLFGWSGNRGTSFGPFVWPRSGVHYLNQHIFRITSTDVNMSWLYWCLKAVTVHVEDQAHGIIGMVHITKGDLGAVKIAIPNAAEQDAIANHLNRETARIDALIEKKTRFIELLREKRQALISQAVKHGLELDVPKEDSGVESLGQVPVHWRLLKLRHVARIVRGASPRPAGDPIYFADSAEGDKNTPWVTVAEITKDENIYLTSTTGYLTPLGVSSSQSFSSGALIFSNSGATLGVPKILKINCCANDGVLAFNHLSPEVNARFLYFYLSTTTDRLRDEMQKGAQPNLNTDIVKAIDLPLPSVSEQEEIVGYITTEKEQLAALKRLTARSIELLRERKAALITAAVTGQIDLREAA